MSDMFYAVVKLETGTKISLPAEHEERGVYVAHGEIEIFEGGRLLFIGDEPLDRPTSVGIPRILFKGTY